MMLTSCKIIRTRQSLCLYLCVLALLWSSSAGQNFSGHCSIYSGTCDNGECVSYDALCDGYPDCADSSDEMHCTAAAQCRLSNELSCSNGKGCYHLLHRCNGETDCEDGSDEWNCTLDCGGVHSFQCPSGECIPYLFICDSISDCPVQAGHRVALDEASCPTYANSGCPAGEVRCAGSHQCIRKAWDCDRQADCPHGDDEHGCDGLGGHHDYRCRADEFTCINTAQCVSQAAVCNGTAECADGSDEGLPSCTRTCLPGQYRCANGECIVRSRVCNGFGTGCSDRSDEPDFFGNLSVCEIRFGPDINVSVSCLHEAVCKNPGRCPLGYQSVLSNTVCIDRDECGNHSVCSQHCENTLGGYSCSCSLGYEFQPLHKCIPTGPEVSLLVANEVDVRLVRNGTVTVPLPQRRSAFAVDYHYKKNLIFWTEALTGAIYSSDLAGQNGSLVVNALLTSPQGIAVDWVMDRIYWTDSVQGRVETALLDGSERVTLLASQQTFKPQAIVVDPCHRHLYWTDIGSTPSIERSNLDGTSRVAIHSQRVYWPATLTLDLETRLMYWSDLKLHTIEVSKLDGSERRVLLHGLRHPFAITQFAGKLYWTDTKDQTIFTTDQFKPLELQPVTRQVFMPTGLKVVHPLLQPSCPGQVLNNSSSDDLCNVTCSYTCLAVSNGSGVCACPPGRPLLPGNNTTCEDEPSSSLYFTARDGVRRLSLDSPTGQRVDTQLITVGAGLHAIRRAAIFVFSDSSRSGGYVFMTDWQLGEIYRVNLDGSNFTTIVADGLERPSSLVIDHINENIYFTDITQHGIFITTFNGTNRRSILRTLSRPQRIAIWPERNLLVFADSQMSRLESVDLIGGHRRVHIDLLEDAALDVAIDKETAHIYCKTIGYETQGLLRVPVDGGRVKLLRPRQGAGSLTYVTGLTAQGGVVFWTEAQSEGLYSANITGAYFRPQRLLWGLTAVGSVEVFPTPMESNSPCVVNNGNCSADRLCTAVDPIVSGTQYYNVPLCLCPDDATDCQNDIDECALPGVCGDGSDATCTNTIGSFQCSGQRNDCQALVAPCPVHQRCIDTPQSYYCSNCSAAEFVCHTDGVCIPGNKQCDDTADCHDGSDEHRCSAGLCEYGTYRCTAGGGCIIPSYRCDGIRDCYDNSDENDCPVRKCLASEYKCADGRICYSSNEKCDGFPNCDDGSDEWNCTFSCEGVNAFRCKTGGQCIRPNLVCDGRSDCLDASDEVNCRGKSNTGIHCPLGEVRCGASRLCIRWTWYCDHDVDCQFGSDEPKRCQAAANCDPHTEFKCLNADQCLSRDQLCDGVEQCRDGSDEALPACRTCPGGSSEFRCAANHRCVKAAQQCDGVNDCGDWSDETDSECAQPSLPTCSNRTNTFTCAASCILFPATCCPEGFDRLTTDTCYDVNECMLAHRPCNQICTNTPGGYNCSCGYGYLLLNGTVCDPTDKGVNPWLLVANSHDIAVYNLVTGDSLRRVTTQAAVTSLDYHWQKGLLFWTDAASGSIYRMNRLGHITMVVHTAIANPTSLAVDWVHDNLYWAESMDGRIESSDLDGNKIVVIARGAGSKPQNLAVDPCPGYLFWTDFGTEPSIQRSLLSGADRRTIVSRHLYWPSALTIDYDSKLVYWADSKLHIMEYADYNGDGRTLLRALDVQHPYAMTMFDGRLYWADWHNQSILSGSQWTAGSRPPHATDLNLYVPYDVRVQHPFRQPHCPEDHSRYHSHCEETSCSYRCLPANATQTPGYACLCGPQQLANNGSGCLEERPTLLLATHENGLRRLSPHSRVTKILAGRVEPLYLASAIELYNESSDAMVYWSNVDGRILKTDLQGDGPVITVREGSGGRYIGGLSVDPLSGAIHFRQDNYILLYDQVTKTTRPLLEHSGKVPGYLVVWPQQGLMYWDVANEVYSASLDGTGVRVEARSDMPVRIVFDHATSTLFWLESQAPGVVNISSLNKTPAVTVTLHVSQSVRDATLLGKHIYWIEGADEAIRRAPIANGTYSELFQVGIGIPLAITTAPETLPQPIDGMPCYGVVCPSSYVCVSHRNTSGSGRVRIVPACLCMDHLVCTVDYRGCLENEKSCGGSSHCMTLHRGETEQVIGPQCLCPPGYQYSPGAGDCLNATTLCSERGMCHSAATCSSSDRAQCKGVSQCMLVNGTGSTPFCACPIGYNYDETAGECLDQTLCPPCGRYAFCRRGTGLGDDLGKCLCSSGARQVVCAGGESCGRVALACTKSSKASADGISTGLIIATPVIVVLLVTAALIVIFYVRRSLGQQQRVIAQRAANVLNEDLEALADADGNPPDQECHPPPQGDVIAIGVNEQIDGAVFIPLVMAEAPLAAEEPPLLPEEAETPLDAKELSLPAGQAATPLSADGAPPQPGHAEEPRSSEEFPLAAAQQPGVAANATCASPRPTDSDDDDDIDSKE